MSTTYHGLIPPICTPLTSDGAIDEASLHNIVEFQIDAGAQGIFVLGSSGEAIYLDDEDRLIVARAAAEAVAGRVPLLVGALAPSTNRVIQQLELLKGLGADAFVVTAPFYAAMSDTEILRHFQIAKGASSAPILAYDIPGNVGYKIRPATAVALLTDHTVAGLKDSSGDLDAFATVADQLGAGRDGALLSGADTTALRALAAGADGLIPGLSNIRPDLFIDLLSAHREGEVARAAALQRAIATLNQIFRIGADHGLGRHASEIGALKHVLVDRRVITTNRLPDPLEAYPAAAADQATALMNQVDTQLALDLAGLSAEGDTHV
ncbi:dihydrodipicolinate synthase family protein [Tessaracoccus palaemonis]|uniref:Dihydrodipicolinate synthase family protein n=1 Tax=Tessaracoccus palaemonis TaxID=2829499 RepID=A0ABX8SK19_9ACTN|nr:dihydrodipicolinate synthase family protein [Tessaracoccus palaemonis]QXT63721.1 dihydrodipicolinate synthase family protein [Tessaracoccus palaemonis]